MSIAGQLDRNDTHTHACTHETHARTHARTHESPPPHTHTYKQSGLTHTVYLQNRLCSSAFPGVSEHEVQLLAFLCRKSELAHSSLISLRSRGPRRGRLPHVCPSERRRRRVLGRQRRRGAGDRRLEGLAYSNGGDRGFGWC